MTQDWQDDGLRPDAAVSGRPRRLGHRLALLGLGLLAVGVIVVLIRHVATGSAGDEAPGIADPLRAETIVIPVRDGRCDLGRAVAELADRLDLHDWTLHHLVPEQGDPAVLASLAANTGGMVRFQRHDNRVELRIDPGAMHRESARIRRQMRDFLAAHFPADAARMQALFGLRIHRADGEPQRPADVRLNGDVVVLVHGLDDAGRLWGALIPPLLEGGATPAELRYPNDQGIRESAAFLAGKLAALREAGAMRIQLVCHSMGGLVAREMLTSPAHYNGDARGTDTLPPVTHLIMVGTPNHGSEIARLRLAAEARDTISHALSGDGVVFGTIWDGTGEAKLDLLPGSDFIRELNARPHPDHVAITIIAGRASPVAKAEIDALLERLPNANGELRSSLREVVDGVGDGCVSIASTRLAGVRDHVVVMGNHLTMLRQVAPGFPPVPPAVPVILDRLGLASQ